MPAYNFSRNKATKMPTLAKTLQFKQLSQLGLDLVSPIDLMKDGRSPFAKNFRLYAQQEDDRQVAVSNRKGSAFYTTPYGESNTVSQESTAGASTVAVNGTTSVILQGFTAANSLRVSHIDIKIGNPNGATGPVLIQLWDDLDGKPGAKLAESSLITIPTSAAYVTARFVKAPKLVSGADYWIVQGEQDDCTGEYLISTTTNSQLAMITNASLAVAVAQTFSINFKVFTVADTPIIGGHRLERDNGVNITVVVIGTTMYSVDETTHALIPIVTGLSGSATDYSFVHADNKLFWVNGYDGLKFWDGTIESEASNMLTNTAFETNSTGWVETGGGTGAAVARSTAQYHGGAASLSATATAGANIRIARQTRTLSMGHRYKIDYWVRGASAASTVELYLFGPNVTAGSTTNLTTSWQNISFYYTPTVDTTTAIAFKSPANDFFIDDVSIIDTGIVNIVDAELPILSQICFHKALLFGVSSSDPNRLVWSEAVGTPVYQADNVTPEVITKQWYYAWRSVDFWYVPRPHNGSPITAMESFQDSLTIFTQDGKYIFSGFDSGSFTLRESVGFQGALSRRGVAKDENNIYFVGTDGLYKWDGTYDTKISTPIDPLFNASGDKSLITIVVWKNRVRFYTPSSGAPVSDSCIIWNKDISEWEYDTDTYVSMAIPYDDADDDDQLVEISSLAPVMYLAEKAYNNLGAPIDFEYRFNYNSMSSPAQKKRIKKFFPIMQGVDSTFPLTIAIDKDFQNSPKAKTVILTVNGTVFGTERDLGDGVLFGGQTSFKMNKLRLSGYGYYWQTRILRKAVNNRVAFVGTQFSYKVKRI